MSDMERMPTHAVKYPGMPWALDFSGDLIKADVVGMRVARLVESTSDIPIIHGREELKIYRAKVWSAAIHRAATFWEKCEAKYSGEEIARSLRSMAKEEWPLILPDDLPPLASQEDATATLGASAISDVPPKVDPAGNAPQGFAARLQESSMLAHMNDLRSQIATARAEGWDAAMDAAARWAARDDSGGPGAGEIGKSLAKDFRALSGKCPPSVTPPCACTDPTLCERTTKCGRG